MFSEEKNEKRFSSSLFHSSVHFSPPSSETPSKNVKQRSQFLPTRIRSFFNLRHYYNNESILTPCRRYSRSLSTTPFFHRHHFIINRTLSTISPISSSTDSLPRPTSTTLSIPSLSFSLILNHSNKPPLLLPIPNPNSRLQFISLPLIPPTSTSTSFVRRSASNESREIFHLRFPILPTVDPWSESILV